MKRQQVFILVLYVVGPMHVFSPSPPMYVRMPVSVAPGICDNSQASLSDDLFVNDALTPAYQDLFGGD